MFGSKLKELSQIFVFICAAVYCTREFSYQEAEIALIREEQQQSRKDRDADNEKQDEQAYRFQKEIKEQVSRVESQVHQIALSTAEIKSHLKNTGNKY